MKKKKSPLVMGLVSDAAHKIGAVVNLEKKWGYVGQIVFPSGKKAYFRNTSLDLNPMGASEIAKDKCYANYFLKLLGYPTITGKEFYSRRWCKVIHSKDNIDRAYEYARKLGFPVFVKPNSRSQGLGVTKVSTRKDFYKAANFIFQYDRVMLVEKAIQGKDYRIVVLDNKIISVYERVPLYVVGDGVSSIKKLLAKKEVEFKKQGRDTQIKFTDYRIEMNLSRKKMTLLTVSPKGEKVTLLDNANLSTGGTSIDMTEKIHPDFKKIAVSITKDMGLRLCGVDLMISGDISQKFEGENTYHVLEINSAPGLDHYYSSGRKQKKAVEELYLELVKAMSRRR